MYTMYILNKGGNITADSTLDVDMCLLAFGQNPKSQSCFSFLLASMNTETDTEFTLGPCQTIFARFGSYLAPFQFLEWKSGHPGAIDASHHEACCQRAVGSCKNLVCLLLWDPNQSVRKTSRKPFCGNDQASLFDLSLFVPFSGHNCTIYGLCVMGGTHIVFFATMTRFDFHPPI